MTSTITVAWIALGVRVWPNVADVLVKDVGAEARIRRESRRTGHNKATSTGLLIGFCVMMVRDTARA